MTRVKQSPDVAPMVRGAFKRALLMIDEAEKGQKGLAELIRDSLRKDFINTMKMVAMFTPRELEATVEHKRSADDFTDDELLAIAARASRENSTGETASQSELH